VSEESGVRAVDIQEYGDPEVLKVVETEIPRPGPGQVSADVAYTGLNFADLKARGEGYRVPSLPFVPGLEVSGAYGKSAPASKVSPWARRWRP
jgi:NADPH2:quinone reductase